MITAHSTEEIEDILGFVPSYLSIDSIPTEYRRLLWEESKQILLAEWNEDAALNVAAATRDQLHTPVKEVIERVVDRRTVPDPHIYNVVPFFSFVVFRLGLSVAACRYRLDGQYTHKAHAEATEYGSIDLLEKSYDTEQLRPSAVHEGLQTTIPIAPDFPIITPTDANRQISNIYNDLRTALRTPNVNTIFQALAVDPEFLSKVVAIQLATYNRVPSQWRLERWIRNQYATTLLAKSNHRSHRRTLRSIGYESHSIDRCATHIRAFHENIGTLATTLLIAATLLEHSTSGK
ncbi:hypothetical protein [Halalkalicoccus subterraneus]|uniref:hypothetical protein n=1 Tax=Halalkalicoccus subterraneus TaxID=2675002 RepID=UPI0013CEB38A|nr:hypothetical protein [Halalkalicoccus subterraneus]